mgnify:CR=1 FL=1
MDLFLQQVFNGLTLGSVYTLVAIGLTLVFGILHIPNFAHGALAMTTPGDTTMATMKEVEALMKGASARVKR